MSDKKTKVLEKLVTPPGTAKYAWLDKPDNSEYGKGKYKCGQLLEKGDPKVEALVQKLRDLHKAHKGKASNFPVKDGDALAEEDEKKESLRGHWLIVAKTKQKPDLRNSAKQIIKDAPRSGDLVRLAVAVASFDTGANKGITLYLNAVQLLERRAVSGGDMFDDVSDEYEAASDTSGGRSDDNDDGDDDGDF